MWSALVAAVVGAVERETQRLSLDAAVEVELAVLLCISGSRLQI
jgi:hypothetical protein